MKNKNEKRAMRETEVNRTSMLLSEQAGIRTNAGLNSKRWCQPRREPKDLPLFARDVNRSHLKP